MYSLYEILLIENPKQVLRFVGLNPEFNIYCYDKLFINLNTKEIVNISDTLFEHFNLHTKLSDQLVLEYKESFKIYDEQNNLIYYENKLGQHRITKRMGHGCISYLYQPLRDSVTTRTIHLGYRDEVIFDEILLNNKQIYMQNTNFENDPF